MRWAVVLLVACKSAKPEVRITEMQRDGVNIPGNWIEITNLSERETHNLNGMDLELAGVQVTLPAVELAPGDTYVIGDAASGEVIPLDQVETFSLQGSPVLRLADAEHVQEVVTDSSWPFFPGSSISRDPVDEDGAGAWCLTWEASALDFASPGALNRSCGCVIDFEFRYEHATDPALDIEGGDMLHARGDRFELPGESGTLVRSSDETGQFISWDYSTGIVYRGDRGFGEEAFVMQPIEIPNNITDFVSGEWSSVLLRDSTTLCRP